MFIVCQMYVVLSPCFLPYFSVLRPLKFISLFIVSASPPKTFSTIVLRLSDPREIFSRTLFVTTLKMEWIHRGICENSNTKTPSSLPAYHHRHFNFCCASDTSFSSITCRYKNFQMQGDRWVKVNSEMQFTWVCLP